MHSLDIPTRATCGLGAPTRATCDTGIAVHILIYTMQGLGFTLHLPPGVPAMTSGSCVRALLPRVISLSPRHFGS
jgi:hypothetical protein